MSMVCPQCKQEFEHDLSCPTCNCRLMYHLSAFKAEGPLADDRGENWQQTAWGSNFRGSAAGPGVGLRHAAPVHGGVPGQRRRHPISMGDALGPVFAPRSAKFEPDVLGRATVRRPAQERAPRRANRTCARIDIHRSCKGKRTCFCPRCSFIRSRSCSPGSVLWEEKGRSSGSRLRSWLWEAPFRKPRRNSPGPSSAPMHYFEGPVHFGRVCAGILVVVLGVFGSEMILRFIVEASGGSFAIHTHFHERLMLMEVTALATIVGSALSGATTFNGLKQGLCVGLGAASSSAAWSSAVPRGISIPRCS